MYLGYLLCTFSTDCSILPFQSESAEQELLKETRSMEDQERKSTDHKRRICEVLEKAEPLKVRIQGSGLA